MEKNSMTRDCRDCECYAVGCEENCPFELFDEQLSKESKLATRKAMKAERSEAVRKAKIQLNAAKKQKGEQNLHDTSRTNRKVATATKKLEKAQDRRNRRLKKNGKKQ